MTREEKNFLEMLLCLRDQRPLNQLFWSKEEERKLIDAIDRVITGISKFKKQEER